MELPFVSVIIPAYNEEKYIGKCLEKWVIRTTPRINMKFLSLMA